MHLLFSKQIWFGDAVNCYHIAFVPRIALHACKTLHIFEFCFALGEDHCCCFLLKNCLKSSLELLEAQMTCNYYWNNIWLKLSLQSPMLFLMICCCSLLLFEGIVAAVSNWKTTGIPVELFEVEAICKYYWNNNRCSVNSPKINNPGSVLLLEGMLLQFLTEKLLEYLWNHAKFK